MKDSSFIIVAGSQQARRVSEWASEHIRVSLYSQLMGHLQSPCSSLSVIALSSTFFLGWDESLLTHETLLKLGLLLNDLNLKIYEI